VQELRNFVNGTFVSGREGRTSDVIDPSTGEAYAQAPVSDAGDADSALRAAASAFETWRDTIPAPHGGFKNSGYGKDLSMYGYEDYTRIKHVMSYIGS
jgi:acyl-CoA reductase-like NAD-dependent aldehyde dehydrogenase